MLHAVDDDRPFSIVVEADNNLDAQQLRSMRLAQQVEEEVEAAPPHRFATREAEGPDARIVAIDVMVMTVSTRVHEREGLVVEPHQVVVDVAKAQRHLGADIGEFAPGQTADDIALRHDDAPQRSDVALLRQDLPDQRHLLGVRRGQPATADVQRIFEPDPHVAAQQQGLRCHWHLIATGTQHAEQIVIAKQAVGGALHVRHILGMRANAAEWRIDPARVGVMGFSAGGGVAVDLAGNVYVGMHGFPKSYLGGRKTEGTVARFTSAGGGYAPEAYRWAFGAALGFEFAAAVWFVALRPKAGVPGLDARGPM